MISRSKLWKTVLTSWGFTLMGVFNIVVLCVIASFLAMRVIGPESFVIILMPALAFTVLVSLSGEVIVNIIFRARTPHPVRDKRFIDAVASVRRKSRMWVRPRTYILNLGDKPNAMAYGPGLPFLSAMGASRALIDMLDDEELEGVVAHEFAHIKCRDTGILAVISLLLGLIDKMRGALRARNTVLTQAWPALVIGWIIYGIGKVALYISRFSISQERELAADALGASYIGDPRPLIRGLTKLHEWSRSQGEEEKLVRPMFEDLMVSHPGLEERIASLEGIMVTTHVEEGEVAS